MTDDTYRTLTEPACGEIRELGSKFLGFAFPLHRFSDWQLHLEEVKAIHPKATHHCYAYVFGREEIRERANDDGEPSGSAGKPILGQLISFGLSNVLVIVVRYFGGKKLGVPGLIQAYRECTKATLNSASFKVDHFMDSYSLEVPYDFVPGTMQFLKGLDARITGTAYHHAGQTIDFLVRAKERPQLERSLHIDVGGIYPDEWEAGKRSDSLQLILQVPPYD